MRCALPIRLAPPVMTADLTASRLMAVVSSGAGLNTANPVHNALLIQSLSLFNTNNANMFFIDDFCASPTERQPGKRHPSIRSGDRFPMVCVERLHTQRQIDFRGEEQAGAIEMTFGAVSGGRPSVGRGARGADRRSRPRTGPNGCGRPGNRTIAGRDRPSAGNGQCIALGRNSTSQGARHSNNSLATSA